MPKFVYLEADGTVIEALTADVSLAVVQATKHATATTKIDGAPDAVMPFRTGAQQTQYHIKTSGDGTLIGHYTVAENTTEIRKVRTNDMWLDLTRYVEGRYPPTIQRAVNALLGASQASASAARVAEAAKMGDWIETVFAEFYSKVTSLDEASTLAAIAAITWDFTTFDATDPGVTISGILNISAVPDAVMPTGHVNGARLTFNSVSLVDIESGKVRDSADGENIAWSSTLTANIAASGANGLDTGAEASNTWYAVHAIAGGGNAVASLLSLSATAPTLPGTYAVFRRVGWVRNNSSSNFLDFRQTGSGKNRQIRYRVALTDTRVIAGGSATVFADISLATYVPPGVTLVSLQVLFSTGTAANRVELRENGDTSGAVIFLRLGVSTAGVSATFILQMTCDGSRIVEYQVSNASDNTSMDVLGYQDEL